MFLFPRFLPAVFVVVAVAATACVPRKNAGASQIKSQTTKENAEINFNGIVKLEGCSGAIVRFKTSKPDDKAIILTNGHCYEGGYPKGGQVLAGKASKLIFQPLSDAGEELSGTVQAEQLLYATMTNTDIALYQLKSTYAQIAEKFHVQPLMLSDQHPEIGAPIKVVSGYGNKIFSCKIDAFVYHLKEGDWTFADAIRYSQPGCETFDGTSGSPIVHSVTKEVIGINNTGNDSGELCTVGNPCEVAPSGDMMARKGANYGQEAYLIYTCLTENNTFDLSLPGCRLPGAK